MQVVARNHYLAAYTQRAYHMLNHAYVPCPPAPVEAC
jgi:hypothetical protein